MILEVLLCILSFGTCHQWRQRPLYSDSGSYSVRQGGKAAGSVRTNWRHEHGFYQDGTNSGYFGDGGVRPDSKENLDKYNYKPQQGEISRKPELMKEAERNIAKDFRVDNYNVKNHNCRDYKEAANEEYAKLVKERGL